MTRLTETAHQRRIMFAMTIYVVVFMGVWPLAKLAAEPWLKGLYALAPLPPVIYAVWLMALRVQSADELEQRTHLIGLGISAAITSVFTLVAGFLAAAHVLPADWAAGALLWVFPLLMIAYGAGRSVAARRYGTSGMCDEGISTSIRFLYLIVLFAGVAAFLYYLKGDAEGASTALGLVAGVGVSATFFAVARWLRKHHVSG